MRYRTIVADPPWKYTQTPTERTGGGVSAEHQYRTRTTDELAHIDVAAMAAPDAHLYMWVTNPVLTKQRQTISGSLDAIDLARVWGFTPVTLLTWVKSENGAGMGFYFRGDTEHVLFCVRGTLPIPAAVRESNVFRGKKGQHSAKPDAFLDLVERVSPGPYVELFARRARFGWDYWGDQSLGTADVDLKVGA
jgi:N6-adenosine-specific RNA methylase IME4